MSILHSTFIPIICTCRVHTIKGTIYELLQYLMITVFNQRMYQNLVMKTKVLSMWILCNMLCTFMILLFLQVLQHLNFQFHPCYQDIKFDPTTSMDYITISYITLMFQHSYQPINKLSNVVHHPHMIKGKSDSQKGQKISDSSSNSFFSSRRGINWYW